MPIAPPNSRIAAAATAALGILCDATIPDITVMFEVVKPVAAISAKIPNMNGTSPIRVVMNALMAAFEFSFSSHQWPISR